MENKHSKLPFHIIYRKKCYPAIQNEEKYIGTALKEHDAEFIIKACNSYYSNQLEIASLKEKLKNNNLEE